MSAEPEVFDAADLTTGIDRVHGLWLLPLNDAGEPTGPWRHFPVRDGVIRLAEPDPVVVDLCMMTEQTIDGEGAQ